MSTSSSQTANPPSALRRVAVIGAADLGKTLVAQLHCDPTWHVVGFVDDTCAPGDTRHGLPVLGATGDLPALVSRGEVDGAVMAIGYSHLAVRERLFTTLRAADVAFPSVVHPSAYVHPGATLSPGAVIFPGCVLDDGVRVGENTLLNTGCVMAHDVHIAGHTFLGPAVIAAGFVRIGRRCFVGVGTTLIDGVTLANGIQTGGGTVVTKDLNEAGLYVGVPARFIRAAGAPAPEEAS